MKVIFLQDVPNVARAGEIKDVAKGYGRNFLITQKLAMLADSSAIRVLEAQSKARGRIQAQTEDELAELSRNLEGKEVILKVRVGAKGRLYGSITATAIAHELDNAYGLVVDKRKIELANPIHQLGSYEIVVRLTRDITPKIKVTVAAEGSEEKKVKERANTEGNVKGEAELETDEDTEEGVKQEI